MPFLPFARAEIGQEEIDEVVDTLRSGWVTTGPKAKRFEDDFTPDVPILIAMRLSPSDRHAIEIAARDAFPSGTRVVLFGSRVDDARRGGDIDLLIEPAQELSADELVARRSRFVAHLYRLLDEQRIDVLVACEAKNDPRLVVRAAREHAWPQRSGKPSDTRLRSKTRWPTGRRHQP